MATINYPGVLLQEVDQSNFVPNFATSSAAIVGYAVKGDVDDIRLISNSQQFISEYGSPVPGNYFHYSALAYLSNGQSLYCLRVMNGALYGGVAISDYGVTNEQFTVGRAAKTWAADSDYPSAIFYITATNPGVWNNGLGIQIANVDQSGFTFDILVYLQDSDGNYQLVETFTVSRKQQLDGFGRQQYLEDAINGVSKYISVADSTASEAISPNVQAVTFAFLGGTDGTTPIDATYTGSNDGKGWDAFINENTIDVRMLIGAGQTSVTVQTKIKAVAESRLDCVAILDVPLAQCSAVTSIKTWRQSTQNFNSSYCALYAPWLKVYDPYNDKIVAVPVSGYAASQYAYNDYVANSWDAPAGFNRGVLNVLGLDFNGISKTAFTNAEIGTLYDAQVNVVQSFIGDGVVIWGQKTEQTKASALDRVNVRRLMIMIEKPVARQARYFLFQPNNSRTRFQLWAVVDEYLSKLASGGAFQGELGDNGYRVVCDTTNNTPATIDANELHLDIYIKPSRSAEFIIIQAIITKTSASFNEIISRNTI